MVASTSIPTGWFHLVVNFIGPNDGEGLRIYYDEVEARSSRLGRDSTIAGPSFTIFRNLSRRIFIGINFDRNDYYSSVQVDEMFFFNQALTETEITSLSQYMN